MQNELDALPGETSYNSGTMKLFGTTHILLLIAVVLAAASLAWLCRTTRVSARAVRLTLGWGLVLNELIWWWFRYSHEGFRFPVNLPLQLCDITLWSTAIACLTVAPVLVEFAWFAGLAGAGLALLMPDLWSPWPSYPAVYFFVAHGGIVAGAFALVAGRIAPLRPGAMWRAFALLFGYAIFAGSFNAAFGTNYMYLCRKPAGASLLDEMGPWPSYVIAGAVLSLALFWLLSLPVRVSAAASDHR
jgi:hypothetical integral membrane protein (TIGR02206 family)